jgi:hypothetical protein
MDTRPVTVHTCLLGEFIDEKLYRINLNYEQLVRNKVYVCDDNGDKISYRVMQDHCTCRQKISIYEAEKLVDTAQALRVWRKKRMLELEPFRVWKAQQPRVPRIDMISKADIERAYAGDIGTNKEDIEYIEDVHEMIIRNRLSLIKPFREDPTEGRLIFPFSKDERTKGGYGGR